MSDISGKYVEAMTTSTNVQGHNGIEQMRKNAEMEFDRLEKDFKDGKLEQDEYVQKKAMLIRRIKAPNPYNV